MATSADIPLLITSENASSERRISPSWSVAHLKGRLEPITGIPATCQRISLKVGSQTPQNIEAVDEEATQLAQWPLQAYAELTISDTRPPSHRTNYTDPSSVPKYTMPTPTYESLPNSVLAYKKANQVGRFDPAAPSLEQQKIANTFREVSERHITPGKRCKLLPEEDSRRGTVRFVGEVEEIPGVGAWVGVELDEPTGKNDGSVKGRRLFECKANYGVLVRAERVEVGEFGVLDELADEGDEEF
ncbi:uncharacterized protein LTR77_002687 [Saxophila tyrrhenica]|uniref:CAP-Gly domain-containing protein n=1 Tax=Saxophila tyrrhenica TaxID=1690608 RepID=A0AAV9PIU1_9PEZI|nr:hypothetical protein LTR77_002687 [Saxophila tyrrhenica]